MKCLTCPVEGWCRGEVHAAVCDRRNPGHPDYNEAYQRSLPGEAGSFLYSDTPSGQAESTTDLVSPVPQAISFAVVKCPHRTKQPNCGCAGKWRCERDQTDVTFADCVQCQQALANEAPTMTNSEAVGKLAPAILAVLDEDHLLDPNVEFPLDPAFYPISAETQWQWDHEEPLDPGKVAALKIARYMANVLFPAVE